MVETNVTVAACARGTPPAMSSDLRAQQEMLHQLPRTDPEPRARRRAHALLLLIRDSSFVAVARLLATGPHRVRAWRSRFLSSGRQGLGDEPRTGRPPKLDAAALAFLSEARRPDPTLTDCRSRSGVSATCATRWPTGWACGSAPRRCTARCSGWATAIVVLAMP